MKPAHKAALIAAGVLGAVALVYLYFRYVLGPEPEEGEETQAPTGGKWWVGILDDLRKLPNYIPPKECNPTYFDNHAAFVTFVNDALLARFVSRGARGIVIAHAATAGWHIDRVFKNGKRASKLYGFNLWGVVASKASVERGDSFTLLRVPTTGNYFPSRVYSNPVEAVHDFARIAGGYGTQVLLLLDTLGDEPTWDDCHVYCERIKPWFKRTQRTPEALKSKADDFMWIYNKHIKERI